MKFSGFFYFLNMLDIPQKLNISARGSPGSFFLFKEVQKILQGFNLAVDAYQLVAMLPTYKR